MREIRIESFTDIDDAIYWMENEIYELIREGHLDIKGEISLIDHSWRVGVTTNSRQGELFE